ncbi:MAG: acetylxylan esterase [Leptonema sp. (in: bacteria)]
MAKKFPTFDDCYSAMPKIKEPAKLYSFWEEEIIKIKKKPLEPVSKIKFKKTFARESFYEIQFRGHLDTIIYGFLSIPRKFHKVPVVITLHDYWEEFKNLNAITHFLFSKGIAHLHLFLQDRQILEEKLKFQMDLKKKNEFLYPPLFLDIFKQPFSYDYGVFLILNVLRAIDFVRLNKSIRHDQIGILGRGLGCNLAIFAAFYKSESIKVLALERPSLIWIESFVKYSTSQLSKEFQKIIQLKKQKYKVSEVIEFYNDPIYLAGKVNIPMIMSIGLEDPLNPAYSAFGFFNLYRGEKSMQIFTEESLDPNQEKERNTSLKFLTEYLIEKG